MKNAYCATGSKLRAYTHSRTDRMDQGQPEDFDAFAKRVTLSQAVQQGILIIDEYRAMPGAKKAIDEYLMANGIPLFSIEKTRMFACSSSPD
jgi:hypothetical protein